MIRGIEASHSAMKYLQKKQDIVANNISNTGTVGFKEQIITAKSKEKMNIINRSTGEEVGFTNPGVESNKLYEISDQGTIVDTSIQTDFAIFGEGYFTVEMTDGSYGYTRDGSFNFDVNGRLVTAKGYPVIAKDIATGRKTYIEADEGNIKVNSDGSIGNTRTGGTKFSVVKFENPQLLTRIGENLYASGNNQPQENITYTVKQFSLENSNVDMASQMIKMLEVSRGYSANQRAIKANDETLQKAVNVLGSLK
ncbi:flagellar basal-body rod protein FlgG [Clostridium sediminicola]|uniref:flagellar hook-basal body protein n=1 Tax=Clostridium sediminicola TaxID=3114879 RepID=UPI0031F21445